MSSPWRTTVCLALLAGLVVQILHEGTHGVVALLVGKQWQALHLFALASKWPAAGSGSADTWVSASAALVNITCGVAAAVALRNRALLAERPAARLFLLYFAAFSILTGFGYLMMDAAFYRPNAAGDWKRVITAFGGGWDVRAPILVLGSGGVLASFFWIPRASLEFVGTGPGRRAPAITLLLVPFLAVCTVVTALAFGHPLGGPGMVLVGLHYWMGYSALVWAPFIAAGMARKEPEHAPRTVVSSAPSLPWIVALGVLVVLAIYLAMPVDPSLVS